MADVTVEDDEVHHLEELQVVLHHLHHPSPPHHLHRPLHLQRSSKIQPSFINARHNLYKLSHNLIFLFPVQGVAVEKIFGL